MPEKTEEYFINDLVSAFPDLKEEILDEDWMGLTSLQIGCFLKFTQRAIDENDVSLALKCFQFVDYDINKVKFEIENSLVISWINKLDFTKNENLYELFPDDFKDIRKKFEDQYDSPSKNEKLNSFLKGLNENLD